MSTAETKSHKCGKWAAKYGSIGALYYIIFEILEIVKEALAP